MFMCLIMLHLGKIKYTLCIYCEIDNKPSKLISKYINSSIHI
jgi:hypothetical protein